jgi:hypothetical protein
MKLVIPHLFIAAAALAPAQNTAQTSSHQHISKNEVGAQAPLGFFDPLGLVADGDQGEGSPSKAAGIGHGCVSGVCCC